MMSFPIFAEQAFLQYTVGENIGKFESHGIPFKCLSSLQGCLPLMKGLGLTVVLQFILYVVVV